MQALIRISFEHKQCSACFWSAYIPVCCNVDLMIYPPEKWKKHGWHWIDSMDPERELEGFSDADIPDPEEGEEG